MKMKIILGITVMFLFFIFLAGNSAFAWTIDGSKYNYANFATNNATIQFPTSMNGTYGVCNETIWANVSIADTDGLFKKATGCGESKIISNGFTQLCWENESDINGGHCPTQIWDSDSAFAVYHLTNNKDSSKYAHDLTLVNSPVHVKGLFGDALNFSSGSDQYAQAGDLPIKPLTNMSITAWIWMADNTTLASGDRAIISKPVGTQYPSFEMTVWFADPDLTNPRLVCEMGGYASPHYAYSDQVIYPNTWYYATCGHNGTNMVVSVNDNFAMISTEEIGDIGYSTDNLLIGLMRSQYPTYSPFNGIIDEPRLYSRFLSQQERLEKYQEGLDKINSLQSEMAQILNVTINYPPDGTLFTNGTVTIGFTSENAINVTMWGNFSGGVWEMNQTNQTAATIMTILPDGVYLINLQACNGTNCVFATANRTIIVVYDSVPPAIFPSAPYNATYVGDDNIPFNLMLNEAGDTCLVDYGYGNNTMTNSSGNWHFSTPIYVGGTYTPIFSCNDTNGNMNTTAGNTFTVIENYLHTFYRYDEMGADTALPLWDVKLGGRQFENGQLKTTGTGQNILTKWDMSYCILGGCTFSFWMNGTGGAVFAYQDSDNYYEVNTTSTGLFLLKKSNGSYSVVDNRTTPIDTSQWRNIEVFYKDNGAGVGTGEIIVNIMNYSFYIDNLAYMDTAQFSSGSVGIVSYGSANFDDAFIYENSANSNSFIDTKIIGGICGSGVDAADINGDGHPDVASSDWWAGTTTVCLWNVTTNWWSCLQVGSYPYSETTIIGNLSDGVNKDILVGTWASPAVIFFNTSDLVTWNLNFIQNNYSDAAEDMHIVDVDKDGYPDELDMFPLGLTIRWGSKYHNYNETTTLNTVGCSAFDVGDYNKDGNLDIVASLAGLYLWTNHGDPRNASNWTVETLLPDPTLDGYGYTDSSWRDIDNDGTLEILTGSSISILPVPAFAGNMFYLKNESGGWVQHIIIPSNIYRQFRLKTADFNGDNWIDMVIGRGGDDRGSLELAVMQDGNTAKYRRYIMSSPAYVNFVSNNPMVYNNGLKYTFYADCLNFIADRKGMHQVELSPIFQNNGTAPLRMGKNVAFNDVTVYDDSVTGSLTNIAIIPSPSNYVDANVTLWNASSSLVLNMTVTPSTSENITFHVSNLKANHVYMVAYDGINDTAVFSDASGILTFNHDSWSTHIITLLDVLTTNVTFNVKDIFGSDISGVNVSCNNSYADYGLNSPFTHVFDTEYYYNCTFSKSSYYDNYSIFSTAGIEKEINLTLSALPSPTPPIIDPSSITGQLVFTLGFGIMGLFAVLTLLGFGYLETTGKPDPETIAKIMIGVVIIILAIVAVWTGIVTPP